VDETATADQTTADKIPPAKTPVKRPTPAKKAAAPAEAAPKVAAKKAAAKKAAAKKVTAKKATAKKAAAEKLVPPLEPQVAEVPAASEAPATPEAAPAAPATPAEAATLTEATPFAETAVATAAEPSNAEPSTAEPSNAEPSTAEPSNAEPSTADRDTADAVVEDFVLSGELLPAHDAAVQPAATVPSLRALRERPMHAAEFLAMAAVAHYGPPAASSINWLRNSYPNASPEGIARVAAHRFVRQARNRGAIAGLAGPMAVVVDVASLQALHAELILHIAAAHGLDPTAPERAAELLYLQGVHESADEAHAAVEATITPAKEAATLVDPTRLSRPIARTLGLGVLRVGARRVMQMVPGAGAVIGAIANARATSDLANRALRFYRTSR
jgi:hypothetical protein